MIIIADATTNEIVQAIPTLTVGDTLDITGKYVIDIPAGTVAVTKDSYTTPVDGGDVSSLGFDRFLEAFPTYSNIVFNALLTSADVQSLDLTATVDNLAGHLLPSPTAILETRTQTGRGSGPSTGLVALSTVVLPLNPYSTTEKPGVLVTDTIDITAATGGAGASNFLLYWKIYEISVSDDIRSNYGVFAGTNTAAAKTLTEVDQTPADFAVAISTNDGLTYTLAPRMVPTVVTNGTLIRLAFLNAGSQKRYLASYAILF